MAYYDDQYNWIDDGSEPGVNDIWNGLNRKTEPAVVLPQFNVNANRVNPSDFNIFAPDNYGNIGGAVGALGGLFLGGNPLASGLGQVVGNAAGRFFGRNATKPQSPQIGSAMRAEAIANGAIVDADGNVRLADGTMIGPDFNATASYVQQTLANQAQNQQIQDFVNNLNANASTGNVRSTGDGSFAGGSTTDGSTTGGSTTNGSTTTPNGTVVLDPYNVNERKFDSNAGQDWWKNYYNNLTTNVGDLTNTNVANTNPTILPPFTTNATPLNTGQQVIGPFSLTDRNAVNYGQVGPGQAGPNFNAALPPGMVSGNTGGSGGTSSGGGGGGGSGGGGGGAASTGSGALQTSRNVGTEGASTIAGLNSILPSTVSTYSDAARGFSNADLENYQRMQAGIAEANARSTRQAAQQTREANTLLRQGNIQDVADNYQQALALRKAANPSLYSALDQYTQQAQAQSAADQARIAQAGILSREDTRNAQQAAREAWAARGMVNSEGAVGSEILNRDALIRQRQNEARAYGQQSSANLYNAAGANSANLFDPFGTILGQQYGMQTNNMGSNAQLFNQGAALSSGALGNQYAQNVFNPFSQYANDVYGTNVNAYYANQIGAANNAAAIEGARLSGQYQKDAARNNAIYQSAPSILDSLRKAFGG